MNEAILGHKSGANFDVENGKGTRDFSFDFVKGLLINLVVYGHIIQYLTPETYNEDVVFSTIYSFHMPLFVFVSGYFSTHTLQNSIGKCVRKIWHRLLIPAFVWSIVSFIVFYVRGYERGMVSLVVGSLRSVWFLYCVAILYLVGCLVFKCGKWKYVASIILVVATYLLYNAPGVAYIEYFQLIRQWPLFMMGFFYYEYKQKITLSISLITVMICAVVYVGLMVYLACNHPLVYIRSHENYLLRAIISQTGSIVWFALMTFCYKIMCGTKIANYIAFMGRNTLGIYVMNERVLLLLTGLAPLTLLSCIPLWLVALILTVLLFGVTLLLKKNNFTTKYLLGE